MPAAIPDYVTGAKQGITDAANVVQQYAGKQYSISDELKTVLNDATTPGKQDWANINATAMTKYLASPTEARAKYRDPESENYIFNPHQSAAAMQEYTDESQIPFLASSQLFGMFNKGEKEMIDSGTRAFQAKQSAAETAYNIARNVYSDLLDEFKLTESLNFQQEELDLKKKEAAKGSGPSKRSTQVIQLDGMEVLVDTQTGEKIQILGPVTRAPTPSSLINLDDKPYSWNETSATLNPVAMPAGTGNKGNSFMDSLKSFFSPK